MDAEKLDYPAPPLLGISRGMEWMKEPEVEWPCRKSFGLALAKKIRKDMMADACPVMLAMKKMHDEEGKSPRPQGKAWIGS